MSAGRGEKQSKKISNIFKNSQKVDPEHTGTGTGILFLNQKFTHKKLNQKQRVFFNKQKGSK